MDMYENDMVKLNIQILVVVCHSMVSIGSTYK